MAGGALSPVVDLSDADDGNTESEGQSVPQPKQSSGVKRKRSRLDDENSVYTTILEKLRSGSCKWSFLEEAVCLKAWKVLHGVGSRRFNRLKKHGQNGFPSPPVDLRYLKRPNAAVIKQSRASVVSFLTEIYHSLAETLPDVRDETWDIETSLVLGMEPPDPYEDQLTLESVKETPVLGEVHKRKRKMQKSVKVNPHRQPNSGGMFEEKWLPPGQMKDLWSQYKKRVWLAEFPFLKFRQVRQPPECTTCIKHKLLIRGPRAHVIGALIHGRGVVFAVTEPDLPKDATTHIELLAHILTLVSKQENLADLKVTLQCDNTSVISDFLQQAQFPFEPASARHAIKIDQTRDWKSFLAASIPIHLKGTSGPGAPRVFRLQRRSNAGEVWVSSFSGGS
ncbi:Uncharacterized protein SCF082_LOCUS18188 [Durusdinium trenchii]|uniref:RNase H type-1 domain-containing protein n=1 Tax=Durusdinium trenchii TaxID=1381693 RepID=A0ABP0KP85_9DINO